MQSNFCCMDKPHASGHWEGIKLEEQGTLFHLHSWCDTRLQVTPFSPSSLHLFAVLHLPRQHSAWHKAKFWVGTAACGSYLCSLPPFPALPAFAENPLLGFASWMVAANASGGWKPDFPVYEREGCAGGCIFQERGVQYSFSFTRLNNSKNVPLCGLYPLAL